MLAWFYYAINTYGTAFLTGIRDKNGVTKVINQKVIQENVSEYRKLSDTQSDVTKVVSAITPSLMHIVKSADLWATTSDGIISSFQWGATAIIVTSDGYLLTNKHVVNDLKAKYTAVSSDGKKFTVSNIWLDPTLDLALLKVTDGTGKKLSGLQVAWFVSAESTINIWQFAIVLGSSQTSKEFIQSLGTISQKNITTFSNSWDSSMVLPYYRVDASIFPGFSGGPTLDLEGNIIGVTTAMDNMGQWWYTLPMTKELIQSMLTSIATNGKITRTPLGASLVSLTPTLAQQLGLKKFSWRYVQKTTPSSLASQWGLQKGDLITSINGKEIVDETPFSRYWLGYSSWTTVELSLYRNNDTQKISITIH